MISPFFRRTFNHPTRKRAEIGDIVKVAEGWEAAQMKTYVIVCAALLDALGASHVQAYGLDHLVPVPTGFDDAAWGDDYGKIATTVFHEAFTEDVRARLFATGGGPGPFSANMTFLKQSNADYQIVFLNAEVPLWMYRAPIQAANERLPSRLRSALRLNPADYHDTKNPAMQHQHSLCTRRANCLGLEKSLV